MNGVFGGWDSVQEVPDSQEGLEQARDYKQEFDDFWEAWEEFRSEGDETPGHIREDRFDAYEYGLDECRDVAQRHFSPEVVEEWSSLSIQERMELATQYAADIGEALNVKLEGVTFERCDDGVSGYTSGDGVIHLDASLIENPENIVRLTDTVAHEARHVFQLEAVRDPQKYGVDATTVEEWREAYETYGDNENYSFYNPLGYFYNPLETDARTFGEACAQAVVRNWRTQIAA